MRIRINRKRTEGRISDGWFATKRVAEFRIYLSVHLTEEERTAIERHGIGRHLLIQVPNPPTIVDPEEIERLTKEKYGQVLVRELLDCDERLIGIWPDIVSGDAADAEIRERLAEVVSWIKRKTRPPEVFEL